MAIESTFNQQRKYLRCHMKPASFYYYPSCLPHPELNTLWSRLITSLYSAFICSSESPAFIGISEGEGYITTLHHPSYFLKKLLQI